MFHISCVSFLVARLPPMRETEKKDSTYSNQHIAKVAKMHVASYTHIIITKKPHLAQLESQDFGQKLKQEIHRDKEINSITCSSLLISHLRLNTTSDYIALCFCCCCCGCNHFNCIYTLTFSVFVDGYCLFPKNTHTKLFERVKKRWEWEKRRTETNTKKDVPV